MYNYDYAKFEKQYTAKGVFIECSECHTHLFNEYYDYVDTGLALCEECTIPEVKNNLQNWKDKFKSLLIHEDDDFTEVKKWLKSQYEELQKMRKEYFKNLKDDEKSIMELEKIIKAKRDEVIEFDEFIELNKPKMCDKYHMSERNLNVKQSYYNG